MTASNIQLFDALLARFPGTLVSAGSHTDIHVFHAPNSICSQKVRAVLAHHGIAHWSHVLDIFAGHTYDPDYVRVRMKGCASSGVGMADRHLGTTSVVSSGCDGCVVPTLVDQASGVVTVDSLRICLSIDAGQTGSQSLMPQDLASPIRAELAIVDELPNYQNLAVRVVPTTAPSNAFARSKVERCNALLAQHGDDPVLRSAYEAKRAKEQWAAEQLFSDASVAGARQAVIDALNLLDERLAAAEGPWLFGTRFTMADLFWAAELIRAEDVGLGDLWAGRLPHLAAYYERLCALPSIKSAILDFPGARLGKPANA